MVSRRFFKESFGPPQPETAIVAGAYSYTDRFVTCRLLEQGVSLSSLI